MSRARFDAVFNSMTNGQHKQAGAQMMELHKCALMPEFLAYLVSDLNDIEMAVAASQRFFICNKAIEDDTASALIIAANREIVYVESHNTSTSRLRASLLKSFVAKLQGGEL